MRATNSIAFGFYNGLGDIICDLPIIKEFIKKGFFVEVFVYSWLEEFTSYLLPDASIKSVKNTKDIKNISVKSDEFFLTPNYLHKFSYSKTAFISYILKAIILKTKVKRVLFTDLLTLLNYTFDRKKTYLDAHFFDMSYALISKYYAIDYPNFNSSKDTIKRIYIFPFSGKIEKDYPQEKFLAILKELKDKDITIFVQKKDRDRLKKDFFKYQVKSVSLQKLYDLIDEETLVIANDSGTAHLGALKGASIIALFGETDAKLYAPRGKGAVYTIQSNSKNVGDISTKMILSVIGKLNFT